MQKLEELIQKLCPNGVEYKKICEVTNILRGKRLTKSQLLEDGLYPVYHGSLSPLGYYNKANRESDTVIVVNTGGIGGVGYSAAPFWCSDGCFCIEHCKILINKFIYYFLVGFQDYFVSRIRTGGVPTIDKDTVGNIKIPIPPIEVQEEIVRILDKFTELSAELTAELTARKKQYEFYRDKLILEQENVEYKTLGEIATEMYRGSGIKRDELTPEGISCVRYGEIYTTYDVWFDKCVSHTNEQAITSKKYFENGDILFAITGESVEEIAKSCAYTGNNKCLAGGDIVVMKHKQNPKYLAYALSTTDAQRQKSYGKIKSKVVHASVPSIKLISIPLPPLAVQEKIASILDNFHSLVTDISEGLPAEIEARQKQYEYYRDKLLTFEEIAQ